MCVESESHNVLGQKQLITVIQETLAECRKAGRELTDPCGLEQKKLEVAALLRHLQMVDAAGEDQGELERVLKSLVANPLLRDHQHWRERAQI